MTLFFVYPGDSTIVVTRSGETLEGRITIDPDRPTHQRISLGDVQVQHGAEIAAQGCVALEFLLASVALGGQLRDLGLKCGQAVAAVGSQVVAQRLASAE